MLRSVNILVPHLTFVKKPTFLAELEIFLIDITRDYERKGLLGDICTCNSRYSIRILFCGHTSRTFLLVVPSQLSWKSLIVCTIFLLLFLYLCRSRPSLLQTSFLSTSSCFLSIVDLLLQAASSSFRHRRRGGFGWICAILDLRVSIRGWIKVMIESRQWHVIFISHNNPSLS